MSSAGGVQVLNDASPDVIEVPITSFLREHHQGPLHSHPHGHASGLCVTSTHGSTPAAAMSIAAERSPSLFVRDSSSEQSRISPGPSLRPPQDNRSRRSHHHHHHHHHNRHVVHSSRSNPNRDHHHHHHHHRHGRANVRHAVRQTRYHQGAPAPFIDLTEEPDDPVETQRPQQQQQPTSQSSQASSNPRRTSQRATTPPRLARSDGTLSRANMPELIDLTGDSPEAEQPRRSRPDHVIALPVHPHDELPPPRDALFRVDIGNAFANIMNPRGLARGFGGLLHGLNALYDIDVTRATQPARPERLSPKVPRAPTPPTRSGFTRSTCAEPKDDTIMICPCCEEELAYDRNYTAPDSSSGSKKRKRAAGEHHFWAVKECGHVYCAECFENRVPTKARPNGSGFSMRSAKDIRCVVDDCESKVFNKGAWVGLYASG